MGAPAFGFLLNRLRGERGLSLRELSQLAEVDHAYIYRLETGEKESPSDEVLSKLIRVLKPGPKEGQMLRYLAEHPEARIDLVEATLEDSSISFNIFASAAAAPFRGAARPEAKVLLSRVKQLYEEIDPDG